MSHLYDAISLKRDYPSLTQEYSVEEIKEIWEDYSYMFAAGWLIPDNDSVEYVFGKML